MTVLKDTYNSDQATILQLGANQYNYKSTTEDAVTLTVDEFVNGIYHQSGTPGTSVKTTPTAAAIVAAMNNPLVGTTFEFIVLNAGDGALTITGGTGVTVTPIATITAAKSRKFVGVVTAVGTPAVLLIALAELA